MLKASLALLAALSLSPAFASPTDDSLDARIERLSQSKRWWRLMHYKHALPFGFVRSRLEGPDFFFSPKGRSSPLAEMKATIEAFSKDLKIGRLKQHPQCAFPERYSFLKSELGLKTQDVECPKLKEFLDRFNAESVTLVFSSAYPNNPGSMFGHTFLRVNSKTKGERDEKKLDLLDWGISFAAAVGDDENGFTFIVLGLAGGYAGQFSMLPYYAKVNEYSNSESRDLWEYELSLTPEETMRVLRHAWELETNTWFPYYFIDENCSYQLNALIEAAKPDWDITHFFIHATPADSVKELVDIPGAVRKVSFRPSLRKRMLQKYSGLSSAGHAEFSQIIAKERNVAEVSDPLVLEAVASYLYYLKQRAGGKLAQNETHLLRETLIRRSELKQVSAEDLARSLPPISEDTRPDLGHHTYRISAGGGAGGGHAFQELSVKFAFHDLLNDDLGYTRFSQIDFPWFTLRYVPDDLKFTLDSATIAATTSLFPLTFLEKKPSWRLSLDYYSPKDYGCSYCHLFRGEAGGGATVELFSPDYIVYALVLADIEAGDSLRMGYRWGPKLQVAGILNPIRRYKSQLVSELHTDLAQPDRQKLYYQFEWNQSYSFNQSWEVRAGLSYVLRSTDAGTNYREGKLLLNYYF
jgi:hypothetical protein